MRNESDRLACERLVRSGRAGVAYGKGIVSSVLAALLGSSMLWVTSGSEAQSQPPRSKVQAAIPTESASASPHPSSTCVPPCRAGYVCNQGRCVSLCNPPCGVNEACNSVGECVADAAASRKPDGQSSPVPQGTPGTSTTGAPSGPASLPNEGTNGGMNAASGPAATAPAPGPFAAPVDSGRGEGHRFEIGVRLGYALPMGTDTGAGTTPDPSGLTTTYVDIPLSDEVSGKLPILVEVGYEVSPKIALGVFVQYGHQFVKSGGQFGCPTGSACSSHDIEIGIQAQYHFSLGQAVDPWLGLGVGYEFVSYSYSGSTTDPVTNMTTPFNSDGTEKGPQYLRLQGGVDWSVGDSFSIGPVVSLSVGKYTGYTSSYTDQPNMSGDIPFPATHEWLTIGAKGTFRAGP